MTKNTTQPARSDDLTHPDDRAARLDALAMDTTLPAFIRAAIDNALFRAGEALGSPVEATDGRLDRASLQRMLARLAALGGREQERVSEDIATRMAARIGLRRAESHGDPEPRADYGRLAEALLLMTDLETERVGPRLDITQDQAARPACVEPRVLIQALDEHLLATFHAVDWYSTEALRGLYVEMRLLADEQSRQRHQEYPEAQRERASGLASE